MLGTAEESWQATNPASPASQSRKLRPRKMGQIPKVRKDKAGKNTTGDRACTKACPCPLDLGIPDCS